MSGRRINPDRVYRGALELLIVWSIAAILAVAFSVPAGAQTIFSDGFEPEADFCDHPLVMPAAIQRVNKTWVQAFTSPNGLFVPTYPQSLPGPTPLGANHNQALVVSFTPTPGLSVNLSWDAAQPNGQYGYRQPRVNNGGMFLGISECPADFRPTNSTQSQFHRAACRRFSTAGGIVYSTLPGGATVCRLTAGVKYYLTASPRNPDGDLMQETCLNPAFPGCDVQATHRGQQQ